MTFVVGQRVRVRQYISWPNCGDPHFIVGHFGHVECIDRDYFDVRISRGPDGGKPDERMYRDKNDQTIECDLWPMVANELEAVD